MRVRGSTLQLTQLLLQSPLLQGSISVELPSLHWRLIVATPPCPYMHSNSPAQQRQDITIRPSAEELGTDFSLQATDDDVVAERIASKRRMMHATV